MSFCFLQLRVLIWKYCSTSPTAHYTGQYQQRIGDHHQFFLCILGGQHMLTVVVLFSPKISWFLHLT